MLLFFKLIDETQIYERLETTRHHNLPKLLILVLGLNRTGHMSFLAGQDRTPKFAGQVLPDRTESGLILFNILPTKYGLSILKFCVKSS